MRLPTTPTTTLQRELRAEVRGIHPAGRILLAVDGPDDPRTATFADGLAAVFAEDGSAVFRASMDGFRRPRAARHADAAADGLYRGEFDDATFRRVLIDPFREGWQTSATTGFQLAAFDVARDAPVESAWVTAPRDAVLIVDGVFLLRPEWRGLWHWSVRLEAGPDAVGPGAAAAARAAQEFYVRDAKPRTWASAIVDNTDPALPRRVFEVSC